MNKLIQLLCASHNTTQTSYILILSFLSSATVKNTFSVQQQKIREYIWKYISKP